MVQKILATPNVNVYSGQLGEAWSKVEGVLHYDHKAYILETLWSDHLKKNYNDLFAGHFGVEKILELHSGKYYRPKIRADSEKYVPGCNICITSKAKRYKALW